MHQQGKSLVNNRKDLNKDRMRRWRNMNPEMKKKAIWAGAAVVIGLLILWLGIIKTVLLAGLAGLGWWLSDNAEAQEWLKNFAAKAWAWLKVAGAKAWAWLKVFGAKAWEWLKVVGAKVPGWLAKAWEVVSRWTGKEVETVKSRIAKDK
jgi:hypothetical protein